MTIENEVKWKWAMSEVSQNEQWRYKDEYKLAHSAYMGVYVHRFQWISASCFVFMVLLQGVSLIAIEYPMKQENHDIIIHP